MTQCENCGLTILNTDQVLQVGNDFPRRFIHTECPTEALVQCVLCEQTILAGENVRQMANAGTNRAHQECLLRAAVGGIGHLEDHAHWCKEVGDPDGGRTYRQSAIEVDRWVHEHGIEEATRR